MDLFYRTLGEGFPLVILHGLYGASENWLTIANHFKEKNKVIIPDIRNHGNSPHDDDMDFHVMSQDIKELLDKEKTNKCILMGHSMGGKLAMNFAFKHPERIEKLIVVDVAPKSYLNGYSKHFEFHKNVVNKMISLDLKSLTRRSEAEELLMDAATSEKIVRFLLKSLKKNDDGIFEWKLNLKALQRNLHKLIDGVNGDKALEEKFNLPTLFIRGEKSDYILDEDLELIRKIYTNLEFTEIKDAGHWVHAEKMDEFANRVLEFIN